MIGKHVHSRSESVRRVRTAFLLNLCFTVVEGVGGFLVGSVAIVADAVHDLGDTIGLGVALALEKYADKSPDRRFSYGYRRVSALSALIAGVVLLVGSTIVVVFAVQRLWEPHEPQAWPMLGIAVFGTVVNGVAAWSLSHGETQSERVLTWHLLEDVLGWGAVLVGSVLILLLGWTWIDPFLAIIIGCVVSGNALRHIVSTLRLFLQEVPADVDLMKLGSELRAIEGVRGVHDMHAWSLDGERHVLSCHVLVGSYEDSEIVKREVRNHLSKEGKFHVTIEVELEKECCGEDCDPASS